MIPHSRAVCRHGSFRADMAAHSSAGGYNFPFRVDKDTSFLRRRVIRSIFGRVCGHFPAQAATISHSAPEMIPHSCAGGNNFPFCAEKDTPFPRRTLPRSIPGGFGGLFLRRKLQRSNPRRKMGQFLRSQQQFSAVMVAIHQFVIILGE